MRMKRLSQCLTLLVGVGLVAWWAAAAPVAPAAGQGRAPVQVPRGLPADFWEALIPEDNPLTPEKIALGRDLFFDKRLSADDSISCAVCHDPTLAFTDGKPVAEGIGGKRGARNTPTILNAMFHSEQFWDGRAATLEEQALQPVVNPLEMGMPSVEAVVNKLKGIPEYAARFQKVFGRPITAADVARAIAAFERAQLSGDAPFDRFIAGDRQAISEAAQRGWRLFQGKARCLTCHGFNPTAPFFTDFQYHNIGVGMRATHNFESLARTVQRLALQGKLTPQEIDRLALTEGFSELGRFLTTRQPKDLGAFKTPGLRDVALTAPYMHDGSLKTLREVIEFYNRGGEPNPNLDGGIVPLDLSEQEIADLEAFLETLTGDAAQRAATPTAARRAK